MVPIKNGSVYPDYDGDSIVYGGVFQKSIESISFFFEAIIIICKVVKSDLIYSVNLCT